MNKIIKIIIAILGGIDIFVYVVTPIFLLFLWQEIFGVAGWTGYVFYGLGLLATLFRGIKIGILKYDD